MIKEDFTLISIFMLFLSGAVIFFAKDVIENKTLYVAVVAFGVLLAIPSAMVILILAYTPLYDLLKLIL